MPPPHLDDEFVALPVGQGDAFFLRRGEFTALIDGGKSRFSFSELFGKTLGLGHVNVLVCTHNDDDHAKGIIGFLEGALACDEVWLPDLWGDRLTALLNEPAEFVEELAEDVSKQRQSTLQQIADELGKLPAEKTYQPAPDRGEFLELEQDPDHADNELWRYGPVVIASEHRRFMLFELEPLMLEAIHAAKRIREIAIAAANRGLPIRWFRHSNAYARGGKNQLRPLNSIEVARSYRKVSALDYLALSVSNTFSLVYQSPSTDDQANVIFSADSNLAFDAEINWGTRSIITAPHHGSEDNANTYARFSRETNEETRAIWVRSDGGFKSRPGPSYLKQTEKYCTVCRNASTSKQEVRFTSSNGTWMATKQSRPCNCWPVTGCAFSS
jgi:hypothetical protein